MVLDKFKRINTEDYELGTIQGNVGKTLDLLTTGPLSGGLLVADIVLAIGDNNVAHGLGREPLGYLVVRSSGTSDIYDKTVGKNLKPTILKLNSSAAITVSLYIF